jgi:hypothetical protein
VDATQWHCELVTDPAAQRTRLDKPKVMGVGRRSAAHKARLLGGCYPKLPDKVPGQVLRSGIAPFLPPEADQGGFIAPQREVYKGGAFDAAKVGAMRSSPRTLTGMPLEHFFHHSLQAMGISCDDLP